MSIDKLVPATHVTIEDHIEILSSYQNLTKELNLVSWDNGYESKFDIRIWSKDHDRIGKGITLTKSEARILADALTSYFNDNDEESFYEEEPIFVDDNELEYQNDLVMANKDQRIEELEYENNTLRLMLSCKDYMSEDERNDNLQKLIRIHSVLPESPFPYEYIASFTGVFEDSDFGELHKRIRSKAREMAFNDGGTDIINLRIDIQPIVRNYGKYEVKYFANVSGAIVRRI